MKTKHDPNKLVDDEFVSTEDYLLEVEQGDFEIGQSYEDTPAKTLVCKFCGSDKFKVGVGDYFTALKCETCEYQICIHEG